VGWGGGGGGGGGGGVEKEILLVGSIRQQSAGRGIAKMAVD